jgi:hypothetical protein
VRESLERDRELRESDSSVSERERELRKRASSASVEQIKKTSV